MSSHLCLAFQIRLIILLPNFINNFGLFINFKENHPESCLRNLNSISLTVMIHCTHSLFKLTGKACSVLFSLKLKPIALYVHTRSPTLYEFNLKATVDSR